MGDDSLKIISHLDCPPDAEPGKTQNFGKNNLSIEGRPLDRLVTKCVLLASWWAQGSGMFCGVMSRWIFMEPAREAACLSLLSVTIRSSEFQAAGCGLGGSG